MANESVFNSGVGIPSGGSTGEVLTKDTGTDYDVSWAANVFGSEFQKSESLGESTTSSTTYVQKLRLTTSSLPAGDYIIQWSADWAGLSEDKVVAARIQQDDTTDLSETVMKIKGSDGNGPYVSLAGHAIRTLSGVHTFDIDHKDISADSKIRNARLTLWRVL